MESSLKAGEQAGAPLVPSDRAETVALAGLALQGVLAILTLGVYLYSGFEKHLALRGSAPVLAEFLHLLPGTALWLLAYLRQRLARIAEEEERELDRLRQRPDASSSLFESDRRPEAYSARGRQLKLERILVPAATLLTAAAMITLGGLALASPSKAQPEALQVKLGVTAALLVALAFAAFVFSQYAIGLSSESSCRKLRPPAAYLLSNSFVLFLDAVALVLLRAHLPLLHLILTTAIPLGVALLGLEYVLNFVLDFFRPRVPGKELRPAYDSRLLGLFAEPGSLWGAVADTLDYQFGFRVSRTWFVHFLARLALPLIAFQLLSGLLLTCLVIVGPEEAVLVERLGRPRVQFSPGLHFKLPWPIEQARSLPAESLQSLIIGFHAGDEDSDEEDEHGHSHGGQRPALPRGMVVWTQPHHVQEDYILVASRGMPGTTAAEPASGNAAPGGAEHSVPVNLLSLSLVLHFQIIDAAEYLYGYQSPRHFLENLAYRELVKLASSTDMHEIMGPRRLNLAQEIRERLEAQIANARIGVRIHDLGFLEVHPPVHVGQAFEAIVEAQVHSESLIVQARSEAEKTVREAESQAHSLLQEALAYQFQRVEIGRSTGLSFDHHLAAYQAGRQLYLSRYRLLAMEEALRGKRKLVLPSKMGQQRLILKLEDRLQADLLQIDLQK